MSIIIRASALSAIMTDGKGKDELSVGAKTYVTKLAKEMIYGYDERVSSKAMEKGIRVEDESIDLYNADEGENKGYEWQLRAYMMLWDKPRADIAYCLVSTPDDLIGYESKQLHKVDHINRELRVTIVPYERDAVLENKIKIKVEAARVYYAQVIQEISKQHTY